MLGLFGCQFRINRQRQHFGAESLSDGEIAFFIAEGCEAVLQVERFGIEYRRADTVVCKKFLQVVSVGGGNCVLVVDADIALPDFRRRNGRICQYLIVYGGVLPSLVVPIIEILELYIEYGGLNTVEAEVTAYDPVEICRVLTVVSEYLDLLGEGFAVGYDQAAVAEGVEVLGRIE